MTTTPNARPSVLSLSRRVLLAPTEAAAASRAPASLAPSAWIYGGFLLANAFFYAWKPFDFPDANVPMLRETQDLAFWLKVMLWQPPLELAWIAFLVALARWFADGKLFWRLLGAVAATAAPIVLLVLYKQGGLSRPAYMLASCAWLGLIGYWARPRAPEFPWKAVAALMLALNAIGIAALAPMSLAVLAGAAGLYKGAQIVGGLWILGSGTLALRALTGLRLPRCFMSLLLSMFMQVAFAFTLHMLGLVPKDILKALLYA
jgi:hypothetical protein